MARPVLIIEDDQDISESLKYNLEREGLSTVTAATGEAGLAAYVDGHLIAVQSVQMDGSRILAVYSMLNPDKMLNIPPSLA